ncbi:MAG: hypothetical protein MI923_11975 [Phycisphaerales bacterium]|nr:hypothetical protein [Phycisphaerales bacterium]
MNRTIGIVILVCVLIPFLTGCQKTEKEKPAESGKETASEQSGADHAHAEAPLGTVTIDGMKIELAQGHGKVKAGKEGHLVVKLPYNDNGQSIVRAWIGIEDRLKSVVSKGQYAPSHDDYDIHATAPVPLPANVMWWIEIEKPDGTKMVGSAKPLLE